MARILCLKKVEMVSCGYPALTNEGREEVRGRGSRGVSSVISGTMLGIQWHSPSFISLLAPKLLQSYMLSYVQVTMNDLT